MCRRCVVALSEGVWGCMKVMTHDRSHLLGHELQGADAARDPDAKRAAWEEQARQAKAKLQMLKEQKKKEETQADKAQLPMKKIFGFIVGHSFIIYSDLRSAHVTVMVSVPKITHF